MAAASGGRGEEAVMQAGRLGSGNGGGRPITYCWTMARAPCRLATRRNRDEKSTAGLPDLSAETGQGRRPAELWFSAPLRSASLPPDAVGLGEKKERGVPLWCRETSLYYKRNTPSQFLLLYISANATGAIVEQLTSTKQQLLHHVFKQFFACL
jgi:hypothetical protein